MRSILCRIAQVVVLVAVASSFAHAEDFMYFKKKAAAGGGASCTTPTGDELTESFGDASTSCWTSGPSTCNNTWTATGTNHSITASPGTPQSNTACANSVYFNAAGAAGNLLWTRGSAIDNATAFDVVFSMYIDNVSLSAYGASYTMTASEATNITSGNSPFNFFMHRGSSAYDIFAGGTTDSAAIALPLDTWVTITIHVDAAAAAGGSYLQCTGCASETNKTFTRRAAYGARYFFWGTTGTSAQVYFGNAYVNTP